MSTDRRTPLPGQTLSGLPCSNHDARLSGVEQRIEYTEADIVQIRQHESELGRSLAVVATRLEILAPLPDRVASLREDVARITTRGATLAMVLGLAVPILTALLVWALGTR